MKYKIGNKTYDGKITVSQVVADLKLYNVGEFQPPKKIDNTFDEVLDSLEIKNLTKS